VRPGPWYRLTALAATAGVALVVATGEWTLAHDVAAHVTLALLAGVVVTARLAHRERPSLAGSAGAAFARSSWKAVARDHRALADTLSFALRLALYVSVPATVGLVLLRTPIVRVLFERGRFGPAETSATADALAWYAVGLAGFAGARIAAQAFYALGEASTAVKWGIVSVAANVVAAIALMQPLGHAGLAGASSVGAYVNLIALLVVARGRLGPLGGRALVSSMCRTLLASLPLAGACGLALAVWPARLSLGLDIAWLAATIGVGAGLFWAASIALGLSERLTLLRLYPGRTRDGRADA